MPLKNRGKTLSKGPGSKSKGATPDDAKTSNPPQGRKTRVTDMRSPMLPPGSLGKGGK